MTDSAHFCGNCGAALPSGAAFCGNCGHVVGSEATAQAPQPPQPPPVAAPTPTPPPVPGYVAAGPPPGGPPPAYAAPPAGGDGGPKWLWPAVAIVAVIALLVGVVVVVTQDDDESTDLAAGEIFLEPAGEIGNDPFTDENLEGPVVTTVPRTTTTARPTTTQRPTTTAPGVTAVRSVNGDAVGLYGGTGDQRRCNREAMVSFLQSHPDQANAFVTAINSDPTMRWSQGDALTVAQLPAYLRELTPITLTQDTRVTNHGYRNGRPTPLQSVLQAGTAVLVDIYGVPRARCACGNPLIPPARVTGRPTYVGPPWPGWNPVNVVVVNQVNVEINTYILVDLFTGDLVERPVGTEGEADEPYEEEPPATEPPETEPPETEPPDTEPPPTEPPPTQPPATEGTLPPDLGTGDVQVTLSWTGDVDLDLHVIDPTGTEIYFGNKTSPSGGTLDYDKIPSAGDFGPHVENVFWPTGGAPGGSYEAWVSGLGGYDSPTADFSMEIYVGGSLVDSIGGTMDAYADSEHVTFSF